MSISLKRFEEEMAKHCAPTLAGIKAASIFTLPTSDKQDIEKIVTEYETLLNPKGIYFEFLSEQKNTINILVYNKKMIIKKLGQLGQLDSKQTKAAISANLKSELGIKGIIMLLKLRKSLGQFAEQKINSVLECADAQACEDSQKLFMSRIAKGSSLMSIMNAA